MRLLTLTAFSMLLACTPKPADTSGNGGDADTDSDTDADSDTDSDTDCDLAVDDADADLVTSSGTEFALDDDGDGYFGTEFTVTACDQPADAAPLASANDCNDADPYTHSYSTQYTDADGDGLGDPDTAALTCTPAGDQVDNGDDCDDTDASVSTGGLWYDDIDGDGHGNPATATVGCTGGSGDVAAGDDCNDLNSGISPSAPEICNLIDDDCDLAVDDADANLVTSTGTEFALDDDGDGYFGAEITVWACNQPANAALLASADDCDDVDAAINPSATEVCGDGIDQDCDSGPGPCAMASGSVTAYDAKYKGVSASEYMGSTMGIADIDGDGQNDLLVGAPSTMPGRTAPAASTRSTRGRAPPSPRPPPGRRSLPGRIRPTAAPTTARRSRSATSAGTACRTSSGAARPTAAAGASSTGSPPARAGGRRATPRSAARRPATIAATPWRSGISPGMAARTAFTPAPARAAGRSTSTRGPASSPRSPARTSRRHRASAAAWP